MSCKWFLKKNLNDASKYNVNPFETIKIKKVLSSDEVHCINGVFKKKRLQSGKLESLKEKMHGNLKNAKETETKQEMRNFKYDS